MANWVQRLFAVVTTGVVFAVAVIPLVFQLPIPFVVIQSNSMYPTLVRGDIGLVLPRVFSAPRVGDVSVFWEDDAGRWVAHRIVDGDAQSGFITKGDNNPAADQVRNLNPLVLPNQIAGKLVTIAGEPMRIPLIGLTILAVQERLDSKLFSWLVLILGLMFVISDSLYAPRRRQPFHPRHVPFWEWWIPTLAFVALFMAQIMITNSQEAYIDYGGLTASERVRTQNQNRVEMTYAYQGFLPMILVLYSDDANILFSQSQFWLSPQDDHIVKVEIGAKELPNDPHIEHRALFRVGAFLPVLPPAILEKLLAWNLRGAAIITALVPLILLTPLVYALMAGDGKERGQRVREMRRYSL
ncbi:MAG: signal peptidase I [Chloroflexi bacterium]|nr:signal peptidase I [Anaerolineaceae bacterium]NMB91077.1 signal peptidase I [Chloroflexota bacterium]